MPDQHPGLPNDQQFPAIMVDVKDVNNQQNILAQTVNRVNL